MHGGAAPQVRQAASVRLAEASAAKTLADLVPRDAPPLENVATELARLCAQLVAARDTAAAMLRESDALVDPSTGLPPAELNLWLALVDRSSKALEAAARLGLDERIALVNGQIAERLVDAFRFLIAGLGRDVDDPAVIPVVEGALRMIDPEVVA